MIGKVTFANNLLVYEAIETANNYLKNWKLVSIEDKCKIIDRFVDLLEVNKNELIRICVEEAGKTIKDAIDDLREAIDFCYYYSNQSKKIFMEDEILIGPTGEKNILKANGLQIKNGTVLTTYTGGGGGFEEPLERQPEDVLKDVQNRYVSIEKAKEDYKVVITKNLEIDHKATEDLRKK